VFAVSDREMARTGLVARRSSLCGRRTNDGRHTDTCHQLPPIGSTVSPIGGNYGY